VSEEFVISGNSRQSIDGFGVNVNPIGNWRGGRLRPLLDLLFDDLGATLFRVDPYGRSDFLDPAELRRSRGWNERVEERAFRHPDLLDSWATMRYLERRGGTVVISLSGLVAPSLCADDGVTLIDFEGFAYLCSAFARWARHSEGLRVSHLAPVNETDIGPPEGPWLSPEASVEMLAELGRRYEGDGLGDVGLIAFDQAIYDTRWLEALLGRPELLGLPSVFSFHKYSNADLGPARAMIDGTPGAGDWRLWLTEYGDLDQTGEREWDVAMAQSRRLIGALLDGVEAAIVWDAFDNFHRHDDSWSIYGLLRAGDLQSEIGYPADHGDLVGYMPKPRYYAARHVYRFVPPASKVIELSGGDRETIAFVLPDGGLTVVALNEGDEEKTVRLKPEEGDLPRLERYMSDDRLRCAHVATETSAVGLELVLPPRSLVTLSTIRADAIALDLSPRVL
jgi:hypothetical protein